MSPSLPAFIEEYKPRLGANAVFFPSFAQGTDGKVSMSLGNKGSFGFVLECKGGDWGGPAKSDIHSANQAWVDNPAWRLVEALSTMYDARNHRILIDGWYEDVEPPSEEDLQLIERLMDLFNEEEAKEKLGVKRFVGDLCGKELLVQYLYSTELIIFHIHAGSPVASSQRVLGIVPHKANMRMNGRLVPNQKVEQVLPMIRGHLDKHGYSDIAMVGFGGYPWSKVSFSEPIVGALIDTYREFEAEPEVWPHSVGSAPNYLFTGKEYLGLPNLAGGLGHGGNVHAPNEYLVVEEKGRIRGLATCEKSFVSFLNRFAQDKA
jgi:acetylornithine deacetylase/succinyl-diaminopimelate desuccinylase-like protein